MERGTYTKAFLTSSLGITPSFSCGKSGCGAEKRPKTSLISVSWSALSAFSFASLEARFFGPAVVVVEVEFRDGPRLLGGFFGC